MRAEERANLLQKYGQRPDSEMQAGTAAGSLPEWEGTPATGGKGASSAWERRPAWIKHAAVGAGKAAHSPSTCPAFVAAFDFIAARVAISVFRAVVAALPAVGVHGRILQGAGEAWRVFLVQTTPCR